MIERARLFAFIGFAAATAVVTACNGGVRTNETFVPGALTGSPNAFRFAPFAVANSVGNTVVLYTSRSTAPVATISAQVSAPKAVAFDKDGKLYVANAGVSSSGWVSVYAGGTWKLLRTITKRIQDPVAFAFDSSGNVYVANETGNAVTVYSPGGASYLRTIRGVTLPESLVFDRAGNLYVANQGPGSDSVTVYAPNATTPKYAITQGVNHPIALAIDDIHDVLYVANYGGGLVSIYHGGARSPFNHVNVGAAIPYRMAVDKSGNLSVAYYKFGGGPVAFEVRQYAAKAYRVLLTISNNLSYPDALAFDVWGNLYVSNIGSNSVLAYRPGTQAFFRNFPANGPSALAVAPTTFPSP